MLKCEKGGIRRVLMNLMGNSLKVCVTLLLIRPYLMLTVLP